MGLLTLINNPHVDIDELAYVLFPTNLHPKKALFRSAHKVKTINSLQVEVLSVYLSVSVGELFSTSDWGVFDRSKAVTLNIRNSLVLLDLERAKGYAFQGLKTPVFFTLSDEGGLKKALNEIENKLN